MPNSFRIRTEIGKDKNLQVKLDQDYEKLEILSFALYPNDVYTRDCADYGVVCGRVFCNRGFGIQNSRVAIFIPIDQIDENDPIISTLYPYKNFESINEDGYKYNLLPYSQSHSGHVPVGTFPDRLDALTNQTVIEVYDKYYKFTVKTNESGDFMIFGVPTGQHTLFMQVDLSDIGEFSLTPQDLIRMGRATESQVNGTTFKFSENYSELPQIVTLTKIITVAPFYGQKEICNYNIVRADFDLTTEAQITLQPTAVFMGSLISVENRKRLKKNCKVKSKAGWLCDLITGPGQIETIRHSIFTDSNGLPILENHRLENDGKLIDENGTWLVELPMNLDYIYTDEEGNRLVSNNPDIGVPTKSKYRFKIKWQQSPKLSEENKRAYFLVPNIKEYGWNGTIDPSSLATGTIETTFFATTDNSPSTVITPTAGYSVFQFESSQNIESYRVLVDDVERPEYHDAIPFAELVGSTVKIQYTFIDNTVDGIIYFKGLSYDSYLQQKSYAFSLNWTDYVNPTEAINCDDTFYEFYYNKVYTVSQLIDRYSNQQYPQKTIQIKNITDTKCEGQYNPFPTNDVYYRYDILFILFSFIITILKFVFIPLVIVIHVLAFLWPVFALIILIVQSIIWVVVKICEGINSVANLLGFEIDCPDEPDISSDIFKQNPFKNIKLPLILYTDDGCERCRCNLDSVDVGDNSYAAQLNTYVAQITQNNVSYLSDFTTSSSYVGINTPSQTSYNADNNLPGSTLPMVTGSYSAELPWIDRLPYIPDTGTYGYQRISTSLTISERLNLFNTKAKYFDNAGTYSPGNIGWNQIKTTWQPSLNNPDTTYHFDNVLVIAVDTGTYEIGDIITFQNPVLSNDPNVNVTSGAYNYPTSINLKSAHPNLGYGMSNTTYIISSLDADYRDATKTTCYPSDVEYFQVIQVDAYDDYKSKRAGLSGQNKFSLAWRFLDTSINPSTNDDCTNENNCPLSNGISVYGKVGNADCGASIFCNCGNGVFFKEQSIDAYARFTGTTQMKLIFLKRGVDPNSPAINQRIDLSRLYGYETYGENPNLVIEAPLKLNIPIQPGGENDNIGNPNDNWFTNNASGLQLPRHNEISSNEPNPSTQWGNIFFKSFAFTYNSTEYIDNWSTKNLTYYSALDANSIYFPQWNGNLSGGITNNSNAITVINTSSDRNSFGDNFRTYRSDGQGVCFKCQPQCNGWSNDCRCNADCWTSLQVEYIFGMWYHIRYPNNLGNNVGGYWGNEYVEGGSVMYARIDSVNVSAGVEKFSSNISSGSDDDAFACCSQECDGTRTYTINAATYYSPCYATFDYQQTNNDYLNPDHEILMSNNQRTVIRTDRLPSSDNTQRSASNGFLLHQNAGFAIYRVLGNCVVENLGGGDVNQTSSTEVVIDNLPGGENGAFTNVASSLSDCTKAVDLNSYYIDNNSSPQIHTLNPYSEEGKYKWFQRGTGCYNLVSRPFLSLFGRPINGDETKKYSDIASVVEWTQRLKLNFALCFDIFSHSFSNNWINGTLYAYSFQNVTYFNSLNQPYRNYCKDVVYLHDPQNIFYYRSSPWNGSDFIGKPSKNVNDSGNIRGNKVNLLYPTTVLDMGPKNSYLQELVYSDDFDGYISNQIPASSFQDVSEILNLFVLSRLVNTSFIQLLIPNANDNGDEQGSDDPSIGAFFANTRWNNGVQFFNSLLPGLIDADYSQMISINSQFGVDGFSPERYPNTSIFFGTDGSGNSVFGVTLSGDNQTVDYITPRRTIWNQDSTIPPALGNFTDIPVKTQVVPFYQWNIDYQNAAPGPPLVLNSVYGWQSNNFVTETGSSPQFTNGFFSHGYQSLDRFGASSEYFVVDGNNTRYYKGYIINFDSNGNPTFIKPANALNRITFGAPFHFYFGLIQGASAMDRFITKYVDTNGI